MAKIFGDYDQEQLNAQYNQRTLVPDISPYSAEAQEATKAAREEFDCGPRCQYGPTEDQWMVVYRTKQAVAAPAPS